MPGKTPKALSILAAIVLLLVTAPSRCFAMMDIELVSKERAKALGLDIRANAAGPDAVRVVLEFEAKAELKNFSRVDLEIQDGGRLLVSSTVRAEPAGPGRVVVSFAADRAKLGQFTLRVVVQDGPRNMGGYDILVKDFVDLTKIH